MIINEGEVAVLSAQGELELHVSWCYILVCCRDLHDQLEGGRWGMVSGGVEQLLGRMVESVQQDGVSPFAV